MFTSNTKMEPVKVTFVTFKKNGFNCFVNYVTLTILRYPIAEC